MSHSDVDARMGLNLRRIRYDKGLSMAGLGERCVDKISQQQISKYELGLNQISCARLVEFSCILGVKLQDFFRGINVKQR